MIVPFQELAGTCGRPSLDQELPPCKAVVFEPAGVLYDASPRRRWLWQLASRLGVQQSYEDFFAPWDAEFLPAALIGQAPYHAALIAFLQETSLSSGQRDEMLAAIGGRDEPLEAGVRPMPGVSRSLGRLAAAGLRLAVLTDSPLGASAFKEQLDGLGLGGHFATVISSMELGTTKPNVANYRAALEALSLAPNETVFVGGRDQDLLGARAAQLRTVAIASDEVAQAHATVLSFARLADLLIGWSRAPVAAAV